MRWTWHLVRIPVLGSMVSPSFTEVMTYDEPSRIDFVHDPERTDENAGTEGRYDLTEVADGTHLEIALTIIGRAALPPDGQARGARGDAGRGRRDGRRFSHNLVRHLGRTS